MRVMPLHGLHGAPQSTEKPSGYKGFDAGRSGVLRQFPWSVAPELAPENVQCATFCGAARLTPA